MIKLPIDLICVDGRNNLIDLCLSLRALEISSSYFNFNSVKFISTYKPFDSKADFIKINKLDLSEYSDFLMKKLFNFVDSDFCLLVQSDGFIVRPDLWDFNFLNYDYIGAPWPKHWPMSHINRVGNGGFSIRSKRFLDCVSKLDDNLSDEMKNLSKKMQHKNLKPEKIEDNFICVYKKAELIKKGIKYAPVNLASKFSIENPIDENNFGNSFGFHGLNQYNINFYNKILYNSFEIHENKNI